MAINKVEYGGNTLIDITDTTATESDVLNSKTFYAADGTKSVGTASMGNAKIYYGTSDTEETTSTKIVTCDNFVLETGATISVKFTYGHDSSVPYLNVNNTGSKKVVYKGTASLGYDWSAGQLVQFVYDGTNYIEVNKGLATTTYYGITKLSDSVSSTSHGHSATPYAVKQAYDLANSKQDTLVSGTNIKTINNTSLLGSGNITIGGGGTATDVQVNGTSITSGGVANITTSTLADLIYPVGSIYMSVNSTSPATLFGGTWEQLKDRFLLGAGDTYTNGDTGGTATVTLTVNQMPSHRHDIHYRTRVVQSGTSGVWALGGNTYDGVSNSTNDAEGGGQAHNNMPPYLVVNIWKRTA